MNNDLLSALFSLIGTLAGTFGGILMSSKLTNYRIQQLETKVDRHNGFAEKIPLLEEKIKVVNQRIDKIERGERV